MKNSESNSADSPSELIDERIEELGDWRGEMLSRLRALIKEADPEVAEEWKWRGTPVWSHNGMICTGETYKDHREDDLCQRGFLEGPRACSMPVWKVNGAPSTSTKATSWTRRR